MWLKASNKYYEPLVEVSLGQENHVGKLARTKLATAFIICISFLLCKYFAIKRV